MIHAFTEKTIDYPVSEDLWVETGINVNVILTLQYNIVQAYCIIIYNCFLLGFHMQV